MLVRSIRLPLCILSLAALAASVSAQSPAPPDPRTCISGYVWRVVTPDDLVCVTPEVRAQVQADNRLAHKRRTGPPRFVPERCPLNNPKSRRCYALDVPCKSGFVWRNARPDDYVCVPPQTREQAWADNAAGPWRTIASLRAPVLIPSPVSGGSAPGASCRPGTILCDGKCVASDPLNCGRCGSACPAGTSCDVQQCVPAASWAPVGGECVPDNRSGPHCNVGGDAPSICVYGRCRSCIRTGEECPRNGPQICCDANRGPGFSYQCILDASNGKAVCGVPDT